MTYKLILKDIRNENKYDYTDVLELKLGEVAFDFRGKFDDDMIELKKGQRVYYQHGNLCKIKGEEYILVATGNLIKNE